ncbi:Secologanin synthase [Hordeum vulgare]|nr:Secologanin synthase [Hordeum vulgare]
MSTSSVRSEMGVRSVVVPCIKCPQCGTRMKFHLSNTERHEGWVFYKCVNHRVTCEFWYWDLRYVVYLVENRYLEGNEAVDAIGAPKDRREELNRAANGRASKEMVMMLKALLASVMVMFVLMALAIMKN